MTRDDFAEVTRDLTRVAVSDRVRAAVKAVVEQVIEEEMTEHLGARHRERAESRTGERNGSYQRGLITPVGKIEQLRVLRATGTARSRPRCSRSTTGPRARSGMPSWRCGSKASRKEGSLR